MVWEASWTICLMLLDQLVIEIRDAGARAALGHPGPTVGFCTRNALKEGMLARTTCHNTNNASA